MTAFNQFPQLAAADGSSNVNFTQSGSNAVTRSVESKLRESVSAKDFGAIGDGIADDTLALQRGIDFVATNGGILYVPPGTYITSARLFRASSDKPFALCGAGKNATVIKRGTNFNASVIEFRLSHDVTVGDLTVDGNHAIHTNGNHGLVIYDCDRPRVENVHVQDYKNSGVLVYGPPTTRGGGRIINCSVNGEGRSPVGILIAAMYDSGMIGCSAVGCTTGGTGSDGYGLELKNECDGCFIVDSYAKDCTVAAVFGQDISSTGVKNSRVSVISRACNFAFVCGRSENNHIDVVAEMAGAASGQQIIDIQTNSIGNTVRVTARDVPASRRVVRIRTGCTDNVVFVDCVNALPSDSVVAYFDPGAERNTITLERLGGTPMPAAGFNALVLDFSTSNDNTFRYALYPRIEKLTIASSVITLKDPSTVSAIVDTEALGVTDDLETIDGVLFEGRTITLRTLANARDVVVKHNTGNIRLSNNTDFAMISASDNLTLRWNADTFAWCEVSRFTLAPSFIVVSGTAVDAVVGVQYILTNIGATTVTLPANRVPGDTVGIVVANNRFDNVVARNGSRIMGLTEDLTLTSQYVSITLKFINGDLGWRLV